MGELIPSWNGDGVFTGREPPTSHGNQMKTRLLIALPVFLMTTFAAVGGSDQYECTIWDEVFEQKVEIPVSDSR